MPAGITDQGDEACKHSLVAPTPFALERFLVERELDAVEAMTRTRQGTKAGYVDLNPLVPADFRPTVELPDSDYWLQDVDLGHELLGIAPAAALVRIQEAGRSPLTMEEGIALLLAHPGVLRTANCYQMLGSSAGDKRVPSLWVAKDGRPRLGWCWLGNPHSWLGAASCARRAPAK